MRERANRRGAAAAGPVRLRRDAHEIFSEIGRPARTDIERSSPRTATRGTAAARDRRGAAASRAATPCERYDQERPARGPHERSADRADRAPADRGRTAAPPRPQTTIRKASRELQRNPARRAAPTCCPTTLAQVTDQITAGGSYEQTSAKFAPKSLFTRWVSKNGDPLEVTATYARPGGQPSRRAAPSRARRGPAAGCRADILRGRRPQVQRRVQLRGGRRRVREVGHDARGVARLRAPRLRLGGVAHARGRAVR